MQIRGKLRSLAQIKPDCIDSCEVENEMENHLTVNQCSSKRFLKNKS